MSVRMRRQGREEAFRLLFQADQGIQTWDEMVSVEQQATTLAPQAWEFALALAEGAWRERAALDPVIDDLAQGWSLERMAAADRAVLRLGTFEILHRDDTPVGVAINEAVELAKRYGTEDSARFVNGILGTLARRHNREPEGTPPEAADAAEGLPAEDAPSDEGEA